METWQNFSYEFINCLCDGYMYQSTWNASTYALEIFYFKENFVVFFLIYGKSKRDFSLSALTHWGLGPVSIDQYHRYGRPQAACCEPAGSYDKTTRTAICFEHKTQYLLIRGPYSLIVVFWHISNIRPMISQSQISCNPPTFYIAAIFVKYCYTTGSWLL